MVTRFDEVALNFGVDAGIPIPAMMVPLNNTNQIQLIDGADVVLKAEIAHMVEITEVKAPVGTGSPGPRTFNIKGKALSGKGGVHIYAKRGKVVVATLLVFVLDERKVKIAVRPLQTAAGKFHAKVLPNISDFVDQMNVIWNPQANVLIDLVTDKPALIDDPEENARNMGVFQSDGVTPDTAKGTFQDTVNMLDYSGVKGFSPVFTNFLDNNPVKDVEFTLFIVQGVSSTYGSFVTGLTDLSYRFALVRGDASSRVWAHELGHLLRKAHGESSVAGELMVSGGADTETKIPVKDAVELFNGLYTAKAAPKAHHHK